MSISFSGLASGLDTSTWIKQLTALKQAKVTTLEKEKIGLQTLSAKVSGIKTYFNAFRSSLEKVTDAKFSIASMNVFAQNIAAASRVNVLSATATADAKEATYQVSVSQLASKTKAESRATYNTMITETTMAMTNTRLTDLGVHTGVVKIDNKDVTITSDTTIGSFAESIRGLGGGLDAFYNEYTGVFVTNVTSGMINDTANHTGIVDALHLSAMTQGYSSNEKLDYDVDETRYADLGTELSEYGVSNGTLYLKKGLEDKQITVANTDTIQDLIDKLDGVGITARFNEETGIFSIEDAVIDTERTSSTNLAEKLGMIEDVVTAVHGRSGVLTYTTTEVTTTIASSADTLEQLGAESFSNHKVNLKLANGSAATVTVNSADTIETLKGKLNTAGATADYDETTGIFSLEDCYITTDLSASDAFDLAGFFNLTPSSVTMSSNVQLQKYGEGAAATTSTTFEQLGLLTDQTLVLGCSDGTSETITISTTTDSHPTTLGDVFNKLQQDYHINAGINNGVMNFINTEYGGKTYYITGGTFAEHFGITTDVNSTSTITSSTGAVINVHTVQAATTDTTLGELGITDFDISLKDDSGHFIKDSSNNDMSFTYGTSIALGTVIDAINNSGTGANITLTADGIITSSCPSGVHISGGLAVALGITENIIAGEDITTGTSMTSSQAVTYSTTQVANTETTLGALGLNDTNGYDIIVKDNANPSEVAYSLHVTSTDSLGSIFTNLGQNGGITANINNGVLSISSSTGCYIDNCSFAAAMGISVVNGTEQTVTTGQAVTSQNNLIETITHTIDTSTTLGTALTNPDITTYSLVIRSTEDHSIVNTLTFNKNTATFGDVVSALNTTYGFDTTISPSGTFTFNSVNENFYIDVENSNLAQALGITQTNASEPITLSSSVTSSAPINYSTTVTASSSTTLGNLGLGGEGQNVLNIRGDNGDIINSYTYDSSTTIDTVLSDISQSSNNLIATIQNGVISITAINNSGNYVDGDLAEAFGISTEYSATGNNILLNSVTPVDTSGMSTVDSIGDNTVDTTGMYSLTEAMNLTNVDGFIGDTEYTNPSLYSSFSTMNNITTVATSGLSSISSAISGIDLAGAQTLGAVELQTTTVTTTVTTTQTTTSTTTISVTQTITGAQTVSSIANGVTLTGTYLVSTTNDILSLAARTNAGQVAASAVFVMTNDIDMSGVTGFVPIGGANAFNDPIDHAFYGTFDGNGNVIKNLTYSNTAYDALVGFFGNLHGTVRNLGLENFNLTGAAKVGTLAGYVSGATIDNCYIKDALLNSIGSGVLIGGLIGQANGTTTISNTNVSVSINSNNAEHLGGMIGQTAIDSNVTFTDCSVAPSFVGATSADYRGLFIGCCQGSLQFSSCDAYTTGNTIVFPIVGYKTSTNGAILQNPAVSLLDGSPPTVGFKNAVTPIGTPVTSTVTTTIETTTTTTIETTTTDPLTSGTYLISSTADLQALANYTNQGLVDSSAVFVMTNDIDMSGVTDFTPINCFQGTFDGNGHAIRNLTINQPTTDCVGLFSELVSCTIRNLGLENVDITGDCTVGGIAGASIDTDIENCYVTGDITGSSQNIGGIVGFTENVTINNCYFTGNISASSAENVGGIAGTLNNYVTITQSYTDATITAQGTAGGIVGYSSESNNSINNCCVLGSVSASTNAGTICGWINNGCSITGCHYVNTSGQNAVNGITLDSSNIEVNSASELNNLIHVYGNFMVAPSVDIDNALPITGGTYAISYAADLMILAEMTNAGKIGSGATFVMTRDIDLSGIDWIPIGTTSDPFTATFNGNGHKITGAKISPKTDAVGIFGAVSGGTISNLGVEGIYIHDCGGDSKIGALVGSASNATITNCYTTGNIDVGSEKGLQVGGLIGESNYSRIENCFAATEITGEGSSSDVIGGLVGYSFDSTYVNSDGYGFINVDYSNYSGAFIGESYREKFINCRVSKSNGIRDCGVADDELTDIITANNHVYSYKISNSADLQIFANLCKYNAFDSSEQTVIAFDSDIDMSGINTFKGIGDITDATIYGNGHVISNLSINDSAGVAALFNNANNSVIRDLGLENVNFNGNKAHGLVEEASDTLIDNCYVTGNITGLSASGLVGYLLQESSVENSYFRGTVCGDGEISGLVCSSDVLSSVSDCFFDGTMVGSNGAPRSGEYVIKTPDGTVTNCYSTNGAVAGEGISVLDGSNINGNFAISSASDLVLLSQIYNCGEYDIGSCNFYMTNDIDMSGVTDFTSISLFDGTFDGNGHVISNLTSTSGGLFGNLTGKVKNLGLTDVNITSTSSETGGIANTLNDRGEVTNCYVTGNITGSGSTGGIVGCMYGRTVKNCYFDGNITRTSGNNFGGIVGANAYSSCYIQNSYSNVSFTNYNSSALMGTLVGQTSGGTSNITNCGYEASNGYLAFGDNSSYGDSQNIQELNSDEFDEITHLNGTFCSYANLELLSGEYKISTASDLVKLSKLVNAGLADNLTITLNNDIDMDGINDFIPIGKYHVFTGRFNGNGHTISNLTIDRSGQSNIGLFGVAQYAEINNLKLSNVNISGASNVGGILGYGINDVTISNCCVADGLIEGTVEAVGGIAGKVDDSVFDFLYTNVEINGNNSTVGLGGIAGNSTNSCYEKCYVLGSFDGFMGHNSTTGVFIGSDNGGGINFGFDFAYLVDGSGIFDSFLDSCGCANITALSQNSGYRFFDSPKVNTPSEAKTYNTTTVATTGTKLSDLGLTGSYTITKHTDTGDVEETFTGNQTLGDIASFVGGYLTSDGKFKIEGNSSTYITSMPNALKDALNLTGVDFSHISQSYTTSNQNATLSTYTQQEAINRNTKFSALHLTGTATVSAVGTHGSGTFTVDSDTTIGALEDWFEGNTIGGITFSIDSDTGKVTINPAADCYVDLPDKVKVALGMSGLQTYSTSTLQDKSNSVSTTQHTVNVTQTITGSSTFGQLGINSNQVVYINNNGSYASMTVKSTTTVDSFMNWLKTHGASQSYLNEGVVNIRFDEGSYFDETGDKALNNNIINALKIGNPSHTTEPTGRITNINEYRQFTETANAALTEYTKLGDIEGFTESTLTITRPGENNTSIYLNSSMTVGSLFSQLADKGISATITQSATTGSKVRLIYDGDIQLSDNLSFLHLTNNSPTTVTTHTTSPSNDVSDRSVLSATTSTKLGDIFHNDNSSLGNGTGGYTLNISVAGAATTSSASFDNDSSLSDVFNWLSSKGVDANINSTGKITLNSDKDFTLSGDSLFSFLMGTPVKQAEYVGTEKEKTNTNTHTCNAETSTKLSDLGITPGNFIIINRTSGQEVPTVVAVRSDDTIEDLLYTLSQFNINATLGADSRIVIESFGDISLQDSSSNIVDVLFNDGFIKSKNYSSNKLEVTETKTYTADESTLLSTFDTDSRKSEGVLYLTVNGSNKYINISADETFGSLIEKFAEKGINASMIDGKLTLNSPVDFTVSQTCSSRLYDNLRLNNAITGMASDEELTTTREYMETVVGSAIMGADESTTLKTLGITSGTFIMYKNGQKMSISVDEDETFGALNDKIKAASSNTVNLKFDNGYLIIDSSTPLTELTLGTAVNNASNLVSICGLSAGENGEIKSSRPLYKVNGNTKLTEAGIFRNGAGKTIEGTFEIGNATFEIDENTTINSLISAINSSEESLATAYWDSLAGNFVITSRISGESLINIQAGTSDFTDVLGYTKTYRDGSNNITSWQIDTTTQELGKQAIFTINGNTISNNSNTITSDVSHIEGVTINLKDVTDDEPVTLTISRDTETAANAMQEIVDSYNELMTNVEKELSQTGDLKNQTTLKMIKNTIRNYMLGSVMGSSGFKNLAAIGISPQAASNGNISTENLNLVSLDKEKFSELFKQNPNAIQEFLVGNGSTTGVLTMLENTVEQALSSASGYFTVTENSYKKQIERLDSKIAKAQESVNSYKARLEAKFQSMDLLISNIQNQYNSFLQG